MFPVFLLRLRVYFLCDVGLFPLLGGRKNVGFSLTRSLGMGLDQPCPSPSNGASSDVTGFERAQHRSSVRLPDFATLRIVVPRYSATLAQHYVLHVIGVAGFSLGGLVNHSTIGRRKCICA